jgi:AcrR family transcriptional regulator
MSASPPRPPRRPPTDEELAGLAPGVARAWGLTERPRSGPQPTLTLAAITRAAIELADSQGYDALSMARIADSLGYTTMSLYRHVSSKDELMTLVLDAVTGEAMRDAPPPPDSGDWRGDLTLWSEQQMTVLLAHPWILAMPIQGPPMGPHSLRFIERALVAMRALPLEPFEKMAVIGLLSSYSLSEARLMVDARQTDVGYGEQLRLLVDPEALPELHAIVESGQLDGVVTPPQGEVDDATRFGIERILDGIAAFIAPRLAP